MENVGISWMCILGLDGGGGGADIEPGAWRRFRRNLGSLEGSVSARAGEGRPGGDVVERGGSDDRRTTLGCWWRCCLTSLSRCVICSSVGGELVRLAPAAGSDQPYEGDRSFENVGAKSVLPARSLGRGTLVVKKEGKDDSLEGVVHSDEDESHSSSSEYGGVSDRGWLKSKDVVWRREMTRFSPQVKAKQIATRSVSSSRDGIEALKRDGPGRCTRTGRETLVVRAGAPSLRAGRVRDQTTGEEALSLEYPFDASGWIVAVLSKLFKEEERVGKG